MFQGRGDRLEGNILLSGFSLYAITCTAMPKASNSPAPSSLGTQLEVFFKDKEGPLDMGFLKTSGPCLNQPGLSSDRISV